MKTSIKDWKENFNQQLAHIQIEFDALFVKGKIEDYFILEENVETGMLTLRISGNGILPKQIEDLLIDAFNQSKP
ncbi:MAG TPA: hypothetical protein VGE24_13210 [Emticicia sp.]